MPMPLFAFRFAKAYYPFISKEVLRFGVLVFFETANTLVYYLVTVRTALGKYGRIFDGRTCLPQQVRALRIRTC